MSESPAPISPEEAQNLTKLARVQEYKDKTGMEDTEPTEQVVSSENAPALPQRVRSNEVTSPSPEASDVSEPATEEVVPTTPDLRLVTSEVAPESVESTDSPEQVTPSEPEVSGIYTSQTQHSEHISPENPGGAAEALASLRASDEAGLAQPTAPLETETPAEFVGKRVDTTVAVDGDSRAPKLGGEHAAEGKHVSEVEITPDSEVQTGGAHAAREHVSDVAITPDSEVQTGGDHRAETVISSGPETTVEAPVAPTPEKRRGFGSFIKRLINR